LWEADSYPNLCDCVGYGSHGTVVYAGLLDGRSIAVKRMLVHYYDIAQGEMKLLMESDAHLNVIRYFAKVLPCFPSARFRLINERS